MTKTHLGLMWLIRGDIVSETLATGGDWDSHVYDALAPYCGGTVIDVGANVGALTLRFAAIAKKVIAYEPNHVFYACLRANVPGNVWCINWGVYSENVRISPSNRTEFPESGSGWIWLPTSVGSPLTEGASPTYPRHDVTAIKIDAQGADLHAMIGLRETIEACHPTIAFEFEEGPAKLHGHTWEDYAAQLEAWGYVSQPLGKGDHLALWGGK